MKELCSTKNRADAEGTEETAGNIAKTIKQDERRKTVAVCTTQVEDSGTLVCRRAEAFHQSYRTTLERARVFSGIAITRRIFPSV